MGAKELKKILLRTHLEPEFYSKQTFSKWSVRNVLFVKKQGVLRQTTYQQKAFSSTISDMAGKSC